MLDDTLTSRDNKQRYVITGSVLPIESVIAERETIRLHLPTETETFEGRTGTRFEEVQSVPFALDFENRTFYVAPPG